MSDEQKVYVPFMARVTMNMEFENSAENRVDPDIVELHLGGKVYTDEIVREGVGLYTYEMVANSPGTYKRIWVGKNTDNSFYAESKAKIFIVTPSQV